MTGVGKFGRTAVRATELMVAGKCGTATEAWKAAVASEFPGKKDAQKKSCPKAAFLGLCEEGLVGGVKAEECAAGAENKAYAIEAVRLLQREPDLAKAGQAELWRRVMNGRKKEHNHQMDVVLALWAQGLLDPSQR